MNANATITDSSQYVTSPQRASADTSCKKCGTDLKLGAEFCHVCGRWVFGSNLSRLMRGTREALAQTGIGASGPHLHDDRGYFCGDFALCGNSNRPQDDWGMAGHSVLAH